MPSEADQDRLHWANIFALRTLHEATLPALLQARNYAVRQLLQERNDLLEEWYSKLGLLFCMAGLTFPPSFFTEGSNLEDLKSSTPKQISSLRATPTPCFHTSSHLLASSYRCVLVLRTSPLSDAIQGQYGIFICTKQQDSKALYGQPLLREMVDASTQTEDADNADMTLTKIEAPVIEGEIASKKRKRCD